MSLNLRTNSANVTVTNLINQLMLLTNRIYRAGGGRHRFMSIPSLHVLKKTKGTS